MGKADRKTRRKQDDAGGDPTADAPPQVVARDVSGDVGRLDGDEWAERAWPARAGHRGQGFRVVVQRSVLNAVHYHGQANRQVEVCGVLVGNVYRDPAGAYALVEASIQGDFAGSANAQVTFTAQTWEHIQGVMEREHPDQRIIGWYHTHPGFGIFLSDMDLFIHGHFFNLPWQTALVYDPVSEEEGAFLWRDGRTERGEFAVDEDEERAIPTIPASAEVTAAALADFSRRMQRIERRLRTNAIVMPLLLLVALAWPFVLYTVMSERRAQWSPIRGANAVEAPKTAATTQAVPAASQPVVAEAVTPLVPATPPSTAPVVAVDVPTPPPAVTQPTVAATTQGTPPELIRPGPNGEKRGPKILENPPETPAQPHL